MSRPRSPGRPSGDSPPQRERLLDAAVQAFAHTGIQAASLRGIAEHAGVTPALVNYYFGNKARLVEAMIEERFMPLIRGVAERLQQAGDDPHELVQRFVRGMSEMVVQHPWIPPLWVREILCEGGALREQLTSRIAPLIPLLLAQRFAAAQARGGLNPALDPRLLVVSLIGLTMLPYAAAPLWRGIFANPQLGDEALISHTLALLEHGMEA
ncbi:TetR/AcrR family transcriptional regulator [Pseudomonas benzenivorans]|uniref:TetR/AcrR family transcriptional regulator n=1 Tax=Pseudomonas benzenivorans TaxID=556533 RepID=A0ABY5H9F9_9PSED|nr:TetR/AcrR family transcriptional regulator [Pseudomonas benzenivorans]UTW08694.1 TetR/AcrR family transcriptional regulator [Pseudomonas benzenivorans]